ncbi:hypothetical protein [Streptomyces sp. NPDC058272]|uniref:hypothetical protein n=1 Tax=Streptomyces sp. NPDC058272 TaxID=3346415 RepID=UPI0036EE844B
MTWIGAGGAVGVGERRLEFVLSVGGDDVRADIVVAAGACRRGEHLCLECLRFGGKFRACLQQLLEIGFIEGDAVRDPVTEARHDAVALLGEPVRAVGVCP